MQEQLKGDYNQSYAEFWGNGNIYFDGDYDLATMFPQTSNFTQVGGSSTCLADCYTGLGPGCDEYKSWLTNYGTVPAEDYCLLSWGNIDTQYNEIKLCAAKAIGDTSNSNLTKLEYVNIFRYQAVTQKQCRYQYCYPLLGGAITATECPSNSSGVNTASTSSAENRVTSKGFVLLLLFGWLAVSYLY